MQLLSEDSVAFEDDDMNLDKQPQVVHPIVQFVMDKFEYAKTGRMHHEQRWQRAYYNYRGLYGKEIQFLEHEKSRAFVKITKTKVHAAFGQLTDVIFANSNVPIEVVATPVPEGIEEDVHIDPKDMQDTPEGTQDDLGVGYTGDGSSLKPGTGLTSTLGAWLNNTLNKLPGIKIKKGPSVNPDQIHIKPAQRAAEKMTKKIQDQLVEADALSHIRNALFECTLLGTGVIKGPFTVRREYPYWDETGVYTPIISDAPSISYVSVWNSYPDPDAVNQWDMEYFIERHKATRTYLRSLASRPAFSEEAIDKVIELGPNYCEEWWEHELDESDNESEVTRWEVLEFWGTVPSELVEDIEGFELPDNIKDQKEFAANIFVCNGHLLRVVINPFKPARIPYNIFPYEINPYSIFGVGIAENMEDSQTLMNGFTRLAVDNAVLSSNIMLEVDETYMVPGQDMKAYPGKIWRRQGGPPGQAIFAVKWDNVTQECMLLYDRFRQMADEATGIPSFSHGSTGVMGTGRTASGMSMLMGAAAMSIKTVVKNVDDFLLRPLGQSLYSWNMQFNFDPDIRGDLAIKANGTAALMQKEIKSQKLMQLLSIIANPMIAPLVKIPNVVRDIAKTLELNPDDYINNPEEAKAQALILNLMGQVKGPSSEGGMLSDNSGNASMTPVNPGEPGFSASPQTPNPPTPAAPNGQQNQGIPQ